MSLSTLLYKARRGAQNWQYSRTKKATKRRKPKAPKRPAIAGKRTNKALMTRSQLAKDIQASSRGVLNAKLR